MSPILSLAEARRFADRALARADAAGLRVGIVVLNQLGELVQMDRMDGAPLMSADVAEAKARTALNFQKPTSAVASEFDQKPKQLEAIQDVVHFKLMPIAGGLPIARDGEIVGAIGVSGADGQDEDIAREAIS